MSNPQGLRVSLVARWALAIIGTTLTVWSFVSLVEVDNRLADVWPWWLLGLTGATLTMLALGSPWARRRPDRDLPEPGG